MKHWNCLTNLKSEDDWINEAQRILTILYVAVVTYPWLFLFKPYRRIQHKVTTSMGGDFEYLQDQKVQVMWSVLQ